MPEKRKVVQLPVDENLDPENLAKDQEENNTQEFEEVPLATAKDIPKPSTSLAFPVRGKLNKLRVSLLGDMASAPTLEEIKRINRSLGEARTPLMSVILAIVADAGGSISLEELCRKVRDEWNRPFPSSPYTPEEFIYLMIRNSDNLRIT